MRRCPVCKEIDLIPVMTRQGVEVDICPECQGIWLDKGEIYLFAKYPEYLYQKFKEALKIAKPSERCSPVSGKSMLELPMWDGQVYIDYDPETEGIWLDKDEIKEFPIDKCKIDIDKEFQIDAVGDENTPQDSYVPTHRVGLLKLPDLNVTSGSVLFGMYAILTFFLITSSVIFGLSPSMALLIGVAMAIVQFALGPWIMDLTLNWLYRIQWLTQEDFQKRYGTLFGFVEIVAKDKGINVPMFGIIDDGAPQAFTYGHHPNNARIVVSRGLLELLTEKEVEAVVAHEIGHAVHWDMLIMTIAQLVPLLLYYVYRTLISVRSRANDRSSGARIAVAIGAYVLYIISEYIVLWFSRIREYYADRFSGQVTGEPENLCSALVKIGYGLAGREPQSKEEKKSTRSSMAQGIEPMGIFSKKQASALAVVSSVKQMGEDVDRESLKEAAKWDLWNPWALYYELHSTHPLIAKRIRMLSNLSQYMGRRPYVEFDEKRPESYWDEFFEDLAVLYAPLIGVITAVVLWILKIVPAPQIIGVGVLLIGIGMYIRVLRAYPKNGFVPLNVKTLLKKVKVSSVRPVPCKLKGTIIGRGIPGLIYSEDFVMQDETGIIFLDYQQPLGLWNFFFGLLKAKQYQNQDAEIIGWYRRAPIPYIELKEISVNGKVAHCYTYTYKFYFSFLLMIVGIVLLFVL